VFVRAEAFPVGVRIAQYMERGGGYVPIGYWQLWNPSGSGVARYPEAHGTAARTDFQHGTSWPRERRELLAEIIVIHLESAPGMALNWEGRRTPPFQLGATPETVAPAPSRRPRFPIRYRQPWALRLLLEVLREWLLILGRLFSRLRGRET
jgi:hypothetical protein